VKVYHSIEEFNIISNAVVTTGTFDGVHRGHQIVLNQLKNVAHQIDGESVLLTFFPHPRMVLHPDSHDLRLINTIQERIQLLRQSGINHLIIHPFSKDFSRLSSIEFVRDVLVNKIGATKLVIGHDHHFGKNREGTFEHLQEFGPVYGFDVEEIPAQEVKQVSVSSTKIRTALKNGDIITANQFLGYKFSITGTVVDGDKIGRKIGFPTANIKLLEWYKLIPANGVYAVKVFLKNNEYFGMLNIGNRPTLNKEEKTIEVNIFNFDDNIYNNEIKIEFFDKIRDEQKFNDIKELKSQLTLDKKTSISILR